MATETHTFRIHSLIVTQNIVPASANNTQLIVEVEFNCELSQISHVKVSLAEVAPRITVRAETHLKNPAKPLQVKCPHCPHWTTSANIICEVEETVDRQYTGGQPMFFVLIVVSTMYTVITQLQIGTGDLLFI